MNIDLSHNIFDVNSESFERLALDVFRYQAVHNEVYAKFLSLLKINIADVESVQKIPFLPISFFKTHKVYTGSSEHEIVFTSSGTTGTETSKHFVKSLSIYEESFTKAFNYFYGDISKYCILALLPSYLEREGSSLVYMANRLICDSQHPQSGFFLHNPDVLVRTLVMLEASGQPTILIGVTFALLELAKKHSLKLSNTIVMETGGMKGRGKELIRSEMHKILMDAFGINAVHSEYGMTELLSQAYSKGDGIFATPPWMKVLVRDAYDPFTLLPPERSGALNIIDLANVHSCSFIQTDDLGVVHSNETFEVLGRLDGSQIRGCNLLVL